MFEDLIHMVDVSSKDGWNKEFQIYLIYRFNFNSIFDEVYQDQLVKPNLKRVFEWYYFFLNNFIITCFEDVLFESVSTDDILHRFENMRSRRGQLDKM